MQEGLIAHQVNCLGKMNSGVAKAIRTKWPLVFHEYSTYCASRLSADDLLGSVQVVEVGPQLWVANVFSQLSYGYDGQRYTSYDALDTALTKLQRWMFEHDLTSMDVHHPLIGAGLGGGNWNVISAIIEHRIGSRTTLWTLPGS
jgi:O-acetyl-ADP-ribose deacetylase (regulator of RNase III)